MLVMNFEAEYENEFLGITVQLVAAELSKINTTC
jgi:hypothetical protein